MKKVARAPGAALSDFAIFKLIAHAWGGADMFRTWSSPEAAFQIAKELSRDQPCDFTGIRDYAHIEAAGGIQWPFTGDETAEKGEESQKQGPSAGAAAHSPSPPFSPPAAPAVQGGPARERRLFADGQFFTPDRRARFVFDPPRPMPEAPDAAYPFLLLTGRGSSAQWHTGSRTNKSAVLRKLAPTELTVEIHPDDAERHDLVAGCCVRIRSRRGSADAVAVVTSTVQPGHIFLPMHFAAVNQLTFAGFDPHSRQPSYKACAVAISRARGT